MTMRIAPGSRLVVRQAKHLWPAPLMLFLASPSYSVQSNDSAIRALEAAQQAAWNGHDARAYAALFTPDANLVTSRGAVLRGGEIEQRTALGFASVFAFSNMRLGDMSVRSLGADVGLARVSWSISGIRSSDGGTLRARQIVQTQVLVRAGGSWRIAHLQDTVVLDDDHATSDPAAEGVPSIVVPPAATKPRRCVVGRANGECLIYGKK